MSTLSRDQRATIVAGVATATAREVGAWFGISRNSVQGIVCRARQAGVEVRTSRPPPPGRRAWTPADDAKLAALRNAGVADGEIARRVGRTVNSCCTRMSRLRTRGFEVAYATRWSDAQVDALVTMHVAGASAAEIASAIGRSEPAVLVRIAWLREEGTLAPVDAIRRAA